MATLFLLRHLKSSWAAPDLADRDRPLAPRGRKAGRVIARYLARAGIRPELVLCSAAQRTRSTLEIVGADWLDSDICVEQRLYEASDKVLLARLRAIPPSIGSVMLIGHNPGLETLAALLCGERGDEQGLEQMECKFPTGALAVLERDQTSWAELGPATCKLQIFVRPADLE